MLLADSHKFDTSSGTIVCGLDRLDTIVTDAGISREAVAILERNGVEVILAR